MCIQFNWCIAIVNFPGDVIVYEINFYLANEAVFLYDRKIKIKNEIY